MPVGDVLGEHVANGYSAAFGIDVLHSETKDQAGKVLTQYH